MLDRFQPLAIYMEGSATGPPAKMGHGIIRYSPNPITCVIDSTHAGLDMREVANLPIPIPIVANVGEAAEMGAQVFVLGIAPGGGLIPPQWLPAIDEAVSHGLSVLNGLHDRLEARYPVLRAGQWIWDVRTEPVGLKNGTGAAAKLTNRRLLMIGTDMSVGKMTAGLEIYRAAREQGIPTEFVATGQIGITVTGSGIPLDAIRLDFASGAVERELMRAAEAELIVVEGQGSLIHPGSTANLPLLRGACPTHLVLCHRAGQQGIYRLEHIKIPTLDKIIRLYEDLAEACGTFQRPRTVAISLNTFHMASDEEARAACDRIEAEFGLPCVDPIRHGPARLLDAVLA
jgi:D-glutamate N-acetyltransferase